MQAGTGTDVSKKGQQSKSIMLAGRPHDKIIMAGEHVLRNSGGGDVISGSGTKTGGNPSMLMSRNALAGSGVDKQFSNDSTVKIDLNS